MAIDITAGDDAFRWSDDPSNPPCSFVPERALKPGFVATPYGELYFLNLHGSRVEMARQQGERFKDIANLGVIPFFRGYLEGVLSNSPVKRVAGVVDWATGAVIGERLKRNVPQEFAEAIGAFAEAAGLPERDIYQAYLMPETFLFILSTYHRILGTEVATGLGAPPMFGCTSAITVPPKSNTTLHGRNFDYFGVDAWDRYPTVVFHHPDQGHDYVSMSTAGLIGGGITSMNSAGLTLAVHQHHPNDYDLDGVPVGIAGDYAIQHASNIDEAVEIVKDFPPCAGWTYVMTEGDTGRAAIYEVAKGRDYFREVQPDEAAMGYANVYWGKELHEAEVEFYPEFSRCNYARQDRVVQCLRGDGARDVQDIAKIIGDLNDPESGKERLMGPTIVNVTTVGSVVFEPEHRRVWVGAGRSPTCRGWYIPFTMSLPDSPDKGGVDTSVMPFVPFPGWHESPSGKAFEYYRKAMVQANDGEPDERLIVLVEHALALHSDEPYLRVLAGLISLRLGKGLRAEGAFQRALEKVERRDRRAEIQLFMAWAMDLQGSRSRAKKLYKDVSRNPDADTITKQRAVKGRLVRFTAKDAAGINIDFIYGGVP